MRSWAKYFIITTADILFLSLMFHISCVKGQQLLIDGDTGWHIRTGEYILKTLSVPYYDIFSFHTPAIPWTAHEWLSEVIMAIIYKFAGLTGIVVFFSFLISISYYLMYKAIRSCKGNLFIAILFVLLAVLSSQIHWLARPHMFSILLMVIWYYILDAYQNYDKKMLYLLPIIMLVWANLHGGFIAGFILLIIYITGNLIKSFKASTEEKYIAKQRAKTIAIVSMVCILVTLINPNGYHTLLFPFNLVSRKYIMDNVSEFMSPNFHETLYFKYLLYSMIIIIATCRKKLNIIEIMLIVIFTDMALYAARYIPLFAIVVTPIIVRQADSLIVDAQGKVSVFLKKRADRFALIENSTEGLLWPFFGTLIIVLLVTTGKLSYSFDPKIKPVAAVEFLKKEHIEGNLFSTDQFGDYIIYAAWPKYKVFFDGRSDMYGVDIMKEYSRVSFLDPRWYKILEKYKINLIVHNVNSPLSVLLKERNDWKLIYEDKVADIFVKKTPENSFLISKFKNVRLISLESRK